MQPALDFARDEALDVRPGVQPGSPTSARAAAQLLASGRQPAKLARLLQAYQAAGADGLTDSEAHRTTGLPRQSICSLRAAAKAKGYLEATAVTRLGEFGHAQAVWRVTTTGARVRTDG